MERKNLITLTKGRSVGKKWEKKENIKKEKVKERFKPLK